MAGFESHVERLIREATERGEFDNLPGRGRPLNLPDGASGRDWAVWLALGGSLGIVVGGVLAMRDERLSPPGRHRDLTGRPTPPPAEIETIPAPGREGAT